MDTSTSFIAISCDYEGINNHSRIEMDITSCRPVAANFLQIPGNSIQFVSMEVFLILLLLLMSGFFSGSESALFSIRWWRINYLRHHGGPAGKRLADMMDHPGSVLMTILLGNTIVNVAASSMFEHFLERRFPEYALLASIAIMSIVIMIFCEITPKTIAVQMPEKLALIVARPISVLTKSIFPFRYIVDKASSSLYRFLRSTTRGPRRTDFLALVDEGKNAGVLTRSEHHLMTQILRMNSVQVSDIMVPRTEMMALPDNIDFDQAVQIILKYDYKRIPLYHQSMDNIVGVLYAKDFLGGWLNPVLRRSPRKLARSPVFVPSYITLKQLSKELSEKKRHLAVVMDEYGGTAGMVTHDDILKSIFCIPDSDDPENRIVQTLPEGGWIVDARITWDHLKMLLNLPDKDIPFRTLNGFLMDHFGRVPVAGENMIIGGNSKDGLLNWKVVVLETEPIRIQTVSITPDKFPEKTSGENTPKPQNTSDDSGLSRL